VLKAAGRDVDSDAVESWTVTDLDAARVVGEHRRTGERREWEREPLERGLVLGSYVVVLSTFEFVTVLPVGGADEETLLVVAHGNNGETYGRRYRVEGDEVTLVEEDARSRRLAPDLRATLDDRVRAALADEGYRVA
jgi:hypothetical protein